MTPSLLIEIHNVIKTARAIPGWTVMLVPKNNYSASLNAVASILEAPPSGRTFFLGEPGQKFSVAYSGQENFIPKGTPFDLILAGWSSSNKDDSKALMAWREAAKSLVQSSDWVT